MLVAEQSATTLFAEPTGQSSPDFVRLLPRRPAADVAGGAAELWLLAAWRLWAVRRGPHRLLDGAAAVRHCTCCLLPSKLPVFPFGTRTRCFPRLSGGGTGYSCSACLPGASDSTKHVRLGCMQHSFPLLCRTTLRRKYHLPPACPLLPEAADDCCVHFCCVAAAARQVLQAQFCSLQRTPRSSASGVVELCHASLLA